MMYNVGKVSFLLAGLSYPIFGRKKTRNLGCPQGDRMLEIINALKKTMD